MCVCVCVRASMHIVYLYWHCECICTRSYKCFHVIMCVCVCFITLCTIMFINGFCWYTTDLYVGIAHCMLFLSCKALCIFTKCSINSLSLLLPFEERLALFDKRCSGKAISFAHLSLGPILSAHRAGTSWQVPQETFVYKWWSSLHWHKNLKAPHSVKQSGLKHLCRINNES